VVVRALLKSRNVAQPRRGPEQGKAVKWLVAVLVVVALLGAAAGAYLAFFRGSGEAPADPESKGVIIDAAEGEQILAVASEGGRVFFVRSAVDKEKACDPPCYRAELRELGPRGGQRIMGREGEPTVVAVGTSHVLWGASGVFEAAGVDGRASRLISAAGDRVAIDATHAFFAGIDLTRVDLVSGKVETLVSGANAADVAVDDRSVYFVEPRAGVVWRLLKSGGPRTPIARELPGALRLALGRGRVFVTTGGEGADAGAVWDVATDGTDKTRVASFDGRPVAIGVTRSNIDVLLWPGAGRATLLTIGAGGAVLVLRQLQPPSLAVVSPSTKPVEPGIVSTDRFVYVPSARGLLQVER
jgi:hypothetical protein